jgi:hypothetical protein
MLLALVLLVLGCIYGSSVLMRGSQPPAGMPFTGGSCGFRN